MGNRESSTYRSGWGDGSGSSDNARPDEERSDSTSDTASSLHSMSSLYQMSISGHPDLQIPFEALELQEQIGTSPHGKGVFRAISRQIPGQALAVKIFDLGEESSNATREYLSSIGSLPSHPNIVEIIGIATDKQFAVVSELLPQNLSVVLRKNRNVPLKHLLRVLRDIACALSFLDAHSFPSGTTSLTLSNILLSSKEIEISTAKLADVGHGLLAPPSNSQSIELSRENDDVYTFGLLMQDILRQTQHDSNEIVDDKGAELLRIYSDLMHECLQSPELEDTTPSISLIHSMLNEIIAAISEETDQEEHKDDSSSRLQSFGSFRSVLFIPENVLYGRAAEVRKVMTLFNDLPQEKNGANLVLLVSGVSGVGKSMFVQHCFLELTQRSRGIESASFCSGKFDPARHAETPFSAIIDATKQILISKVITPSKNKNTLKKWRLGLTKLLKGNASVIVDVIPELEHIIGRPVPAPRLSLIESRARFLDTFVALWHALAHPNHRVCLFLDDIHHADPHSIKMIELLCSNPSLFFVGTFRDTDVPTHLRELILNLRKITQVHEIHLDPPDLKDMNMLTANALHCEETRTLPLSRVLYEKTNGNPMLFSRLLVGLRKSSMLQFDNEKRKWTWDLDKIQKMGFTDDVIDIINSTIRNLSKKSMVLLQLASCLGLEFEFDSLKLVGERIVVFEGVRIDDIKERDFTECLAQQHIHSVSTSSTFRTVISKLGTSERQQQFTRIFRFAHARVLDTAYELFSRDRPDVEKIHAQIGRILLAKYSKCQSEIESGSNVLLFNVIFNLNRGRKYITEKHELRQLAELNSIAATISARSGDFARAHAFAVTAHKLLRDIASDGQISSIWNDPALHELAFRIFHQCQEFSYLIGESDIGDARFNEIKQLCSPSTATGVVKTHCLTNLAKSYRTKARQLESCGKFSPLETLCVEFLTRDDSARFSTFHSISGADVDVLCIETLTRLKDPEIQKRLLASVDPFASEDSPNAIIFDALICHYILLDKSDKLLFLVVQAVDIAIANSRLRAETIHGLVTFLYLVLKRTDDIAFVRDFMERLYSQTTIRQNPFFAALYFFSFSQLSHPISNSISGLLSCFKDNLRNGNSRLAGHWASLAVCLDTAAMLNDIETLHKRYNPIREIAEQKQMELVVLFLASCSPFELLKRDNTSLRSSLLELEASLLASAFTIIRYVFHFNFAWVLYVLEDYEQSWKWFCSALEHVNSTFEEFLMRSARHLFLVLIVSKLRQLNRMPELFNEQQAPRLEQAISELSRLSNNLNQDTFGAFYHLAQAELLHSSSSGNTDTIITHYSEAIAAADQAGLRLHSAIANELASEFYSQLPDQSEATHKHRARAFDLYAAIGARVKIELLRRRFPDMDANLPAENPSMIRRMSIRKEHVIEADRLGLNKRQWRDFVRFLNTRFCMELALFVEEYHRYRRILAGTHPQISNDELYERGVEKANSIFSTFIAADAVYELNIDASLKQELQMALAAQPLSLNTLFEGVYKAVRNELECQVLQFKHVKGAMLTKSDA